MKIADKSMSGFKPRRSKTANLPNISNQLRKPVSIGTKFKTVACVVSGVMLFLEIFCEAVS